jgi:hypothetical protein
MNSTLLTPTLPPLEVEVDERAARRALMAQIARLEGELGALPDAGMAEPAPARAAMPRIAAPRLLSLAELEEARDRLAGRIRAAQALAGERATAQEEARVLREEMLLDPEGHRFVRVTNAAVGEPGCLDWHVRPRFGLLGMLMRWWRLVISSGCP